MHARGIASIILTVRREVLTCAIVCANWENVGFREHFPDDVLKEGFFVYRARILFDFISTWAFANSMNPC